MRKHLTITLALGVAIAISLGGIAMAEKPVHVRAGNLELTLNGSFTPKVLSRTKPTPIGLSFSGQIKNVDGTHPPALKKFLLETDKSGAINVKGYPKCKSGQLQSQDTNHALRICKDALIGRGRTDVAIEFPESKTIPVDSKLLIFNGGFRGGITTLYAHAYITVPVPAAIVTTVKIKTIHRGRFGTEAIISVPKIAGGSGSVTAFSSTINKKFSYKGKKVSVLTLKCTDGKILARGEALFSDGTHLKAEVVRTCTPKR